MATRGSRMVKLVKSKKFSGCTVRFRAMLIHMRNHCVKICNRRYLVCTFQQENGSAPAETEKTAGGPYFCFSVGIRLRFQQSPVAKNLGQTDKQSDRTRVRPAWVLISDAKRVQQQLLIGLRQPGSWRP